MEPAAEQAAGPDEAAVVEPSKSVLELTDAPDDVAVVGPMESAVVQAAGPVEAAVVEPTKSVFGTD